MKIVATIINWQNWEITLKALNSLLQLPECGAELFSIIVVDNGSEDDSYSKLARYVACCDYPGLELIRADTNRGYAAGCNIGINRAIEQQAEFVWLLNNDVLLERGALTALISCAQGQHDVGVWGSTILNASTDEMEYAGGGRYWPALGVQRPSSGTRGASLDFIFGASLFVRAEVFERYGLLNERLFLYYEELDFAARIRDEYRLGWCKDSVVRHIGGASTGESRSGAEIRQYHENLSTFRFTYLHHTRWLPLVITLRLFSKPFLFVARGEAFLMRPLFNALATFLKAPS